MASKDSERPATVILPFQLGTSLRGRFFWTQVSVSLKPFFKLILPFDDNSRGHNWHTSLLIPLGDMQGYYLPIMR